MLGKTYQSTLISAMERVQFAIPKGYERFFAMESAYKRAENERPAPNPGSRIPSRFDSKLPVVCEFSKT
jgi:hypothetical protein